LSTRKATRKHENKKQEVAISDIMRLSVQTTKKSQWPLIVHIFCCQTKGKQEDSVKEPFSSKFWNRYICVLIQLWEGFKNYLKSWTWLKWIRIITLLYTPNDRNGILETQIITKLQRLLKNNCLYGEHSRRNFSIWSSIY